MARVLDREEAAAYLGCLPTTLRVWVQQRRVPHVRVNRLVKFRRPDLDDWLDQHFVAAREGQQQP